MIKYFSKLTKFFSISIALLLFVLSSFSCTTKNENVYTPTTVDKIEESTNTTESTKSNKTKNTETVKAITNDDIINNNLKNKKMVVVYFSITGNTERVAKLIADNFQINAIKIEPKVPYEDSDFEAGNINTRPLMESRLDISNINEEQEEEPEYPKSFGIATPDEVEIEKEVEEKATTLPEINNINVNNYDVIFLGYPIWFGDAPKVIYTFLRNIKNKTIIPFCTSDNDSINVSVEKLANYADLSVQIMSGKRFTNDTPTYELINWVRDISYDIK